MKKYEGETKRLKRRGGWCSCAALLTVALLLSATLGGYAHAETEAGAIPLARRTVTDPSDNPSSPGEKTLRGIIGRANSGDIINFASGVAEIQLQGELVISKMLIIAGSSDQHVTIRQTAAGARVFTVQAGNAATLGYLTITGGRRTDYGNGGGILNQGTLIINHCNIVDNTAGDFYGGGISNEYGATLTIRNSLVKGNSASGHGGVWNAGTLIMEDCIVEENTCSYSGGGIGSNREMTLNNCTIRNNRSTNATHSGGGIRNIGTATMSSCIVQGNTAVSWGGGIDNTGTLTLINCIVSDNSAANGGGINSGGYTYLRFYTRVLNNTPDQIRGSYSADKTCVIGSTPGTNSVALGGVAHGASPEPRRTTGEADVTKVENELKHPESGIFKAVRDALSADLGELSGYVSADLYNAFTYEDVPLADKSGEGELLVEFTASWPENVRYYAVFAEYGRMSGALDVTGYALPERGVQFEVKPGNPLPDGVRPPDFYEEGEGLMTWRNVIIDNGPYDHNRASGIVTFRVASIRAESHTDSSGGSGCSAGGVMAPFSFLFAIPLLFVTRKK